jgi:AraC-like DNA-binding protein
MQDLKIKLLYARKSRCNENWNSILHSHPFTEVFFITEGEGIMCLEDDAVRLKQNDLFFVSSGIRHTEDYLPGIPFEYCVLGIDGITIQRNLSLTDQNSADLNSDDKSLFLKTFVYLYSIKPEETWIKDSIINMVQEYSSNNTYKNFYLQALLHILIIGFLRKFESDISINNKSSAKNKQVQFIKNYIDVHYTRTLRLDDLAALCYITKYHLVHEFQRSFKISPIEYQAQKRIAKAKELLTNTDYNMDEIANNLGFNSQSYFNQVFKKKTGLTPTQYRNKHEFYPGPFDKTL